MSRATGRAEGADGVDDLGDPVRGGPGDGFPVLIIDDHELFSTTLTMALRREGFDARTLPVASVPDFLARPSSRVCGLVALDLDLSQGTDGRYVSGVDLVADLRERQWQVLVVSGSSDDPGIAAAIAAGAIGFVAKSRAFDVLLQTIMAAARGGTVLAEADRLRWVERHRRYQAQERDLSRRLARLTRREREVLELLAAGMRAAAVAEHFVVSMPTVRTQIRSILRKLDVGSQLEAVALFRQLPDRPDRPERTGS